MEQLTILRESSVFDRARVQGPFAGPMFHDVCPGHGYKIR